MVRITVKTNRVLKRDISINTMYRPYWDPELNLP